MEPVTINVTFLGEIRSATRRRGMQVALAEGSTVADLLSCLSKRLGDTFDRLVFLGEGTLYPHVSIFVNGKDCKSLSGLETKLDKDDVDLFIVPTYGGG